MEPHRSRAFRRAAATTTVAAAFAVLPAMTHAPARAAENVDAAPRSTDLAVSTPPSVTYRIPALTVTNAGTVLAAFDKRNDQSSDLPGDIDVLVRRSTDSGETWSEPREAINHPGPQGCGDSSLVNDSSSGRIFLFCTYSAGEVGFPNSQPGTSDPDDPNTLHVRVMHSDDDGLTWSEPVDLNPQVKDPSWRAVFTSSGRGLRTSTGRLLQPIVVKDAGGAVHSGNIYSDDGGKTWQRGELLAAGTDESKPVELADGTIVQNSRASNGTTRLRSTSHDGGRSFGAPVPHQQLIDPRVNADEIRVDATGRGPARDWLLFSNPASTTARENLTLRLSCDNGSTWPDQKQLHAGPSGYSVLTVLPNGRIGVFAEVGEQDYTEKLTFTSLALSDVAESCTPPGRSTSAR